MSRLSVLILSNLFPSNADPSYAPFNRTQFGILGRHANVEVFGVVPWRIARTRPGRVVRRERIDGLDVLHPRLFAIPGLPSLNAALYAGSVGAELALARKRYDVILASYAYPDGCAAVMIGRAFGLPVVVKCHGSDLNRVPNDRAARLQIEGLLPRAERVVCVSKGLAARAVELGVDERRIDLVYNGVDRGLFRPRDRAEVRRKLGRPIDRKLVLFVGHLADHKGALDLLAAAEHLDRAVDVVFAGDGPMRQVIARSHRALAIGHQSREGVSDWLAACDLLCLPSWDEGMPNVVREAHASGRPVVATNVGGIPEAVHHPELGVLVDPRQPRALAEALSTQLARASDASRIVDLAGIPSWDESAMALLRSLERAVAS
jgi:glycosyltransferase involved in cell wall biosynthesis